MKRIVVACGFGVGAALICASALAATQVISTEGPTESADITKTSYISDIARGVDGKPQPVITEMWFGSKVVKSGSGCMRVTQDLVRVNTAVKYGMSYQIPVIKRGFAGVACP